jgi:acyl-CoA dehydrogenase
MTDTTFLNWPFFEADHKVLAFELDAWAKQNIAPLSNAPEPKNNDELDAECGEILARIAKGGWLKYAVPDGKNAKFDVRSICLVREILAKHAGLADFVFAMQGLGSGAITLFGSDEQKKQYLPNVRAGEAVAAFALSESNAGSDVAAISTIAKKDGDDYILSGEKTFISNGGIANFYCVFARTEQGTGARGLSAFIVDKNTINLDDKTRIDLLAPHPLANIKLDNCRVPKSALIGVEGQGFKIAMATLDIFRPSVGAAALGFARRAMAETIKHTCNRKAFGGTLADLQMTKSSLADMAINIDASALLIYRAAWQKDSGVERITREAAMAKLFSTESAQQVVDQAVQLHGGAGVVSGSVVEKLYREVRSLRIYEGASEVQKLIIAKQLLSEI